MLFKVELLVVQLYHTHDGDEPTDNYCADLQIICYQIIRLYSIIHQDPREALFHYSGLQAQQRLHAHIQIHTHRWSELTGEWAKRKLQDFGSRLFGTQQVLAVQYHLCFQARISDESHLAPQPRLYIPTPTAKDLPMTAYINVVCILFRQADPLPTYHVAEPSLDCVCALVVMIATVQRHRGRLSAAVRIIRNLRERTRCSTHPFMNSSAGTTWLSSSWTDNARCKVAASLACRFPGSTHASHHVKLLDPGYDSTR